MLLHRIIFETGASSVRANKDLHEAQGQERAEPPDAARGVAWFARWRPESDSGLTGEVCSQKA